MILMIVFLVAGFILLIKGADFFVDGACALSEKLKIPAYIVGLTVVAFGTSLPEAAVSITASIQGSNEIAIGNVIGSNIFNTLVVLGAGAIFAPIAVRKNILIRDFPFCIAITVILLVLLVTLGNGEIMLTRGDGIVLLALFALFLISSVISGKNADMPEEEMKNNMSGLKCAVLVIAGIIGVIAGGQLTVEGAKKLALMAGLSETVVGLTVVAVGTSLPELITSIVAARKNQSDIAVGNAIGSNIFNVLFILGMSSVISPIGTDGHAVADTLMLIATCIVTFIFALTGRKITRGQGIVMVLMYVAYTAYLLIR